MSNDESRMKELLSLHGSDLSKWPDNVKLLGFDAQRHPRLAALIEEEKAFELILQGRRMESPSRDFAARIITASLARAQLSQDVRSSFLLPEIRPSALAAMLALGFAIGFGIITPLHPVRNTAVAQSIIEDEGAIL